MCMNYVNIVVVKLLTQKNKINLIQIKKKKNGQVNKLNKNTNNAKYCMRS